MKEEETINKELRATVEALVARSARYKRECREQGVCYKSLSLTAPFLISYLHLHLQYLIQSQSNHHSTSAQFEGQNVSDPSQSLSSHPSATEATVQRNLAAEKVLEASRQADRADRVEGALRHVRTVHSDALYNLNSVAVMQHVFYLE